MSSMNLEKVIALEQANQIVDYGDFYLMTLLDRMLQVKSDIAYLEKQEEIEKGYMRLLAWDCLMSILLFVPSFQNVSSELNVIAFLSCLIFFVIFIFYYKFAFLKRLYICSFIRRIYWN